jgi:ABC-2 type transport system permease protein
MNWRVFAKKDVLDAYRTWRLGTTAVAFALLLAVPTYFQVSNPPGGGPDELNFFASMGFVLFLVPLAALMLSYDAIAGERERGSLKLLLGLPATRRDVVTGIAVGRAAVVGTAAVVGVVAAALVFVAFGGPLPLGSFVVFLALAVLLGAAYAGPAVGFSAASSTSNRAMATSVGFFLLTLLGWSSVPNLLRYVLNGFSAPGGPKPEWAIFLDRLSPVQAYQAAFSGYVPTEGTVVSPPDAFYYSDWFGVLVLVGWAVVPVALGYRRFRQVDL